MIVRSAWPYCRCSGPVVYGMSYLSHSARTLTAISGYRLLGRSGNRWCSIWKPEAAAEDVQRAAALEVRRAQHLPEVPLRAGLVLELLLGEVHRAVGEVAAEDDHVGPQVARQVGRRVGRERGLPVRARDSAG